MLLLLAPSAMRVAISPIRCETRNEITLYIPLADIDRASSANAPMRNAWNRGSVTESAISSSIVITPNTAWSEFED